MTFGLVVFPTNLLFSELDLSTLQAMLRMTISLLILYLNHHHQDNRMGYKPLDIDVFQDFHLCPCPLNTFSATKFFHRLDPSIITPILSVCAS
jgi:hypothetical protein